MFFDRYSAGVALAQKLKRFRNQNVVIYALPKGGVVVGYEVAKALNLPLDVVLVQKIGHPVSTDYAICAITENGEKVIDEPGMCGLDDDWVNNQVAIRQNEIQSQRELYKRVVSPISAENKIAILIDDGMSTGISMRAAIQTIEDQWPDQIIIATPVAPRYLMHELRSLVDGIFVVNEEFNFLGTVSSYYADYGTISDYEILTLLGDLEKRKMGNVRLKQKQQPSTLLYV